MIAPQSQNVKPWVVAACGHARVPLNLAYEIGNRNHDIGRAVLIDRLTRFSAWLVERLDHPVEVAETGAMRFVSVFGAVGFIFGHKTRTVTPMLRGAGRWEKHDIDVELLKPLTKFQFLRPCLEQAGLSESVPQASLFYAPKLAEWHDAWLCWAAYRLLLQTPGFRALRTSRLHREFPLDPDVRRIALKARLPLGKARLSSSAYNVVWQHLPRMQRVESENPQLLPLVVEGMKKGVIRPRVDPVQALKRHFRKAGVSEAGWRYLCNGGARLFAHAWASDSRLAPLDVAIDVLRTMQKAKLPSPLPPLLQRAWFGIGSHWKSVPPEVIRAASDHARVGHALPALPLSGGTQIAADVFTQIARWATETGLNMDKHQARQGWPWLERRYVEWQRGKGIDPTADYFEWPVLQSSLFINGYEAVPLGNSRALREEAWAMHSCLARLVQFCVNDVERFFSVRDVKTGKRVATVGLRNDGKGRWLLSQVKRKFNVHAPVPLVAVARALAEEYTKRAPSPPLPPGEGLGGEGDRGEE